METETYTFLKQNVKKLLDINLEHYKDEQMKRRLDSWLVRCGAPGWHEYFTRLRSDGGELSRFRDYLTINVSAFFRDPERWKYLQENILPTLLKEAGRSNLLGRLRLWSAGCSHGAEPYTLAMLLDQLTPNRQHELLATDLDHSILARARQGGPYSAEDVLNLSPALRVAYLQAGGPPFYVQRNLLKKITFCEQNMISDPFSSNFDLIICRNVVIYFTAETKDVLYRKFHAALRPGGVLFVGATEILPRPQEIGFRSYGISFYQKV